MAAATGRRVVPVRHELIYPTPDPVIEALGRKILYQPLREALEYAPLATSPLPELRPRLSLLLCAAHPANHPHRVRAAARCRALIT